MKQVREWIGGLVGLTLLIALVLALNSLFQAQAEQTGAAASPTLVKQTGATPTSTPRPPLSFESISVARRYALRVEAPVLTGDLDWAPIFSPDGSSMLIQKRVSPRGYELWRTDLNGRSALLVAKSVSGSPAWSPDGQRIAYIGYTPTGGISLRVVQADGKDDRLITTDVIDNSQVEWLNPQTVVYEDHANRVIAFHLDRNTSERLDPPAIDLPATSGRFIISPQKDRVIFSSASTTWLVPLDTHQVISMPPYVGGYAVAWSPDSSQVAYASQSSIFLGDKDGKNLTEIGISSAWSPYGLAWSPDGRLLAFIAQTEDHGDISEIFLIDVAKKQVKQLTTDGKSVYVEFKVTLTWSPDGTKLVYGTLDSSEERVQVLELTPHDPRPLGSPAGQKAPRPTVPRAISTPQRSDCPYQSGNNGTIWIQLRRHVDPPHYRGELVQGPFEGDATGTYLESVLEGELGGTVETPLSYWQPETAKAVAVASRTSVVDLCPNIRITDTRTSESHFGVYDDTPVNYWPCFSTSTRLCKLRG